MSDVKSEIDEGKIVMSKTEQDQCVGVLNTVTLNVRKMHLLIDQSVKTWSVCNSVFLQEENWFEELPG